MKIDINYSIAHNEFRDEYFAKKKLYLSTYNANSDNNKIISALTSWYEGLLKGVGDKKILDLIFCEYKDIADEYSKALFFYEPSIVEQLQHQSFGKSSLNSWEDLATETYEKLLSPSSETGGIPIKNKNIKDLRRYICKTAKNLLIQDKKNVSKFLYHQPQTRNLEDIPDETNLPDEIYPEENYVKIDPNSGDDELISKLIRQKFIALEDFKLLCSQKRWMVLGECWKRNLITGEDTQTLVRLIIDSIPNGKNKGLYKKVTKAHYIDQKSCKDIEQELSISHVDSNLLPRARQAIKELCTHAKRKKSQQK